MTSGNKHPVVKVSNDITAAMSRSENHETIETNVLNREIKQFSVTISLKIG